MIAPKLRRYQNSSLLTSFSRKRHALNDGRVRATAGFFDRDKVARARVAATQGRFPLRSGRG